VPSFTDGGNLEGGVIGRGHGVNEIKNETVGLQATHREQRTISWAAVPYLSLQTAYDLLILNVYIYSLDD
jgi:hypothetical protein